MLVEHSPAIYVPVRAYVRVGSASRAWCAYVRVSYLLTYVGCAYTHVIRHHVASAPSSTNDRGTERTFRNGIVIYPYSTLHGKPSADADNFIVQRTIQRSFSLLVFYLFSLPLFHKLSLLPSRFVLIFMCTRVYMRVSKLNLLLLFREEQL